MSVVALAVIASWLWLDPDPQAVWQEFVLGENAAKMASAQGYWQSLFSFSGLGSYAMSPLLNAGFLAPWVLAALWWGLRAPWRRGSVVGALVLWMLVWWCVFLLPSQRSARYLIPTLPALAICVALVLPQCFETAAVHIAVMPMGAVAMPLSMLFGPDALAFRLEDSGAAVALCDEFFGRFGRNSHTGFSGRCLGWHANQHGDLL